MILFGDINKGLKECRSTPGSILVDVRERTEFPDRAAVDEIACAGGTGRGTLECLTQLERGLTHMGMRVYDRIPVVRYNRDYILPALYTGGKTYADRLETGFDMYY